MSGFKEYEKYDALGLADLVRRKKVKPLELCDEAISRVERLNPALNAVICFMFDEARKAAKGVLRKGPFAGVPFLLKDVLHAVAGYPFTSGSRSCKEYMPDYDSEIVRRYRDAGLIFIGKTNSPEFGLMPYTEPELFGPTRNPWDRERSPGGSSGGAAAAVAAGMVPMAAGNDGGGSIRIPASCCGLFGMKPTRGRSPLGPAIGEAWQGAAVEHVITRSVRDSAAVLDAVLGADAGAPYTIPRPERPYSSEIKKSPGRLKIGFTTRSVVDSEVHPECMKAVEDAVNILAKLGHRVERAEPDLDGRAIAFSFLMLYMGEVAADIEQTRVFTGRRPRKKYFETMTWTVGLLGRTYSAGDFVREMRVWNGVARSFGRFFEKYDIHLTPVTAYPPLRIGELQPKPAERVVSNIVNAFGLGGMVKASGMVEQIAMQTMAKFPFTLLANLAGLPAMSVPLHWTADGLPCGSHFIGRFGDEATLFRLAAQLEKAKPWFNKRPAAG
ncbi:MAG: hypothetical protein A2176_02285 [Spirochaetes bacterium RBG_13_51_14]|nr:MAG: hypothetical protein A2176_02285 [Spirochaetes bacterium RBG_13_51_14]